MTWLIADNNRGRSRANEWEWCWGEDRWSIGITSHWDNPNLGLTIRLNRTELITTRRARPVATSTGNVDICGAVVVLEDDGDKAHQVNSAWSPVTRMKQSLRRRFLPSIRGVRALPCDRKTLCWRNLMAQSREKGTSDWKLGLMNCLMTLRGEVQWYVDFFGGRFILVFQCPVKITHTSSRRSTGHWHQANSEWIKRPYLEA